MNHPSLSRLVDVQPLPKSCATCAHFDGDGFCAIPKTKIICGFLAIPAAAVCALHKEAA